MSTIKPTGSPAKVQLTLMCLYRESGTTDMPLVHPFVGSQSAWIGQGQVHVVADSVPFHDRTMDVLAPHSGKGVLALFGIRDALEELQHWRMVARNAHAQFAYLQLQIEVGDSYSNVMTRQQLQAAGERLRFVNVRRCSAELQKQWLAQFAQWVQEEGGDVAKDMAQVRQMALRPDLFERLLWSDPDLQHVDVMVLPLIDRADGTRIRQVAYLRAGARIVEQTQGSDQVQVHLPEWMTADAIVA